MTQWLSIIVLLLRVAADLLGYLRRAEARSEAERAVAEALREDVDDLLKKAERARAGGAADGSVRNDDPYLRPDDWTGD